jgi:MSHA biogenesis protein MshN
VRAVAAPARSRGIALAAGAGVAVVVFAGLGAFAWQKLRTPAANASIAPPVGGASASPLPGMSPVSPRTTRAPAASGPAMREVVPAASPQAADAPPAAASARAEPVTAHRAEKRTAARQPSADKPSDARRLAAADARPPAGQAEPDAAAGLSSQQRAENEYRRALQALQDARVSEAMAMLEQAVYLYPRHEAARQTLIGLLVERKQYPEAIRHLQFAVGLDPRQSNMTMLLARLQGEQGGAAIETLQRGLAYANRNADYRALLAGMLQRAQRNREAIDHYTAAVQLQPGQGVWWMGLGISLQADGRKAEAREAFVRARDSGRLSAELQGFVERKLQQIAGQ